MILSIILAITLIFLALITVLCVSAGGAIFIVLFGDVIVCGLFIVWIIKRLMKRKQKQSLRLWPLSFLFLI